MTSVDALIKEHKVVVFSWIHCPFCVKAKEILNSYDKKLQGKEARLDWVVYEVDTMDNGEDLRKQIYQTYKHETVPAIFIDGNFIGGCSELQQVQKSGKLDTLLGV